MIHGIHEAFGREQICLRLNVGLQREHISGGELLAGFEHVVDARRAPGRLPFHADRIRITVWSDYVCPFCYLAEPLLERIRQEYGEAVDLEWRAFELRPCD